jgi:hypothetical protein
MCERAVVPSALEVNEVVEPGHGMLWRRPAPSMAADGLPDDGTPFLGNIAIEPITEENETVLDELTALPAG